MRRENEILEKIPTTAEMTALIGSELYNVWEKLCATIDGADLEFWRKSLDA